MTVSKRQYPHVPADAVRHINSILATLTSITLEIHQLEQEIQERLQKPCCTATTISGRHAIHPTGINCPFPRHNRPELEPNERIRASVRQRERMAVLIAMENAGQIQKLEASVADKRNSQLETIHYLAQLAVSDSVGR